MGQPSDRAQYISLRQQNRNSSLKKSYDLTSAKINLIQAKIAKDLLDNKDKPSNPLPDELKEWDVQIIADALGGYKTNDAAKKKNYEKLVESLAESQKELKAAEEANTWGHTIAGGINAVKNFFG